MNIQRISPRLARKIERKRFLRRVRSRLIRKLKRGGVLGNRVRAHYKIGVVDPHGRTRWRAAKGHLPKASIKIPDVLLYYKNPEETGRFFADLQFLLDKHYRAGKAYVYDFSHEKTKNLGLAESFLFDRIVGEHKRKWQRERNVIIGFSGKISHISKEVNNFLLSFGWLKELGIKPNFGPKFLDKDYEEKYETYKKCGSRLCKSDAGEGSKALIDYFDKCLRFNGFTIRDSAKSDLIDGVGEIICNAEEHSGTPEGEWHVLGCYNKDTHSCDFAIINWGRTIYQSLSDERSTAAEVIGEIEGIVLSHRSTYEALKGFVAENILRRLNQEEPIWNVMALQDGISSQRTTSGEGNTRGQGLMDFFGFIRDIKKPYSAELFLLSGHSLIRIDYGYPIVKVPIGPDKEERRRIVFNKSGNLLDPSDSEKVVYLGDGFPGTIIAGSFKIDRQHLIEQQKR